MYNTTIFYNYIWVVVGNSDENNDFILKTSDKNDQKQYLGPST